MRVCSPAIKSCTRIAGRRENGNEGFFGRPPHPRGCGFCGRGCVRRRPPAHSSGQYALLTSRLRLRLVTGPARTHSRADGKKDKKKKEQSQAGTYYYVRSSKSHPQNCGKKASLRPQATTTPTHPQPRKQRKRRGAILFLFLAPTVLYSSSPFLRTEND